jgi:signal transduction histidine kinase
MANVANPDASANKLSINAGRDVRLGLLGRAILQSLPVGVVAYGPNLRIVEANPQAAKLIELGDYIDKSLAKGTDKDGSPGLDWNQQLKEVLSKNQPRTFDNINYTMNGKMRLLRIVCTPLKTTESAEGFGGTVIIEDITDEINTQRQLASVEKLAAIGQLASRVAHELNNPMDGILRYVNLSLRIIEQENLEKPKEYLTHCRQGLMRMVQIVSELLEFSRNSYVFFEYAKIERIIEDAVKTMDERAESLRVRISRNYASDIPKIRSSNLFQVFCNLIKNALDAMPDGGQLSISTRLSADNTAVAEFRDTGTGLPTENTEAIFEPFFTTKDKIKGTGLGLAISKDIIERHNGRITAENAAGGGSVFTVYLPVTSEDS